ncbi:MAG: GTP-binding protein [Planctomycetota bacterium]|nr:MAG: GTP-binding protein [Planctomycetota bacterium]
MQTRCGYVSIVGKPNVGKSTLLNAFAGKKVSIVSEKPGTTRHRVYAAVTKDNAQALFADTPGLFKPTKMLDKFMERMVVRAVEGVDLVLLVSDDAGARENDRRMLTTIKIRAKEVPVILVLNKMDLMKRGKLITELVEKWRKLYQFRAILPISAQSAKGLPLLWQAIAEALPEREFEVKADEEVGLDEKLWVADLIREKVLTLVHQEVPHAVAVIVQQYEEKETLLKIVADLVVERDSQKGILVGAGGSMIKAIGTDARKDIEKQLNKKVFLELFVKVREKWRNNPSRLKEYGYED